VLTSFIFVADNRIGDDGASALAAALKKNHTLTSLHVGGEYLKKDRLIAWNALCTFGCVTVFLQHVVLDGAVSQAMGLVLSVQQRWQQP
jgi:hypothetical protein